MPKTTHTEAYGEPALSRYQRIATCGAVVDRRQIVAQGATCPDCNASDAETIAALEALGAVFAPEA